MHESYTKALSKYIILFDKIRNIYRFKNRHFNQVLTYEFVSKGCRTTVPLSSLCYYRYGRSCRSEGRSCRGEGRSCRGEGRTCRELSTDRGAVGHLVFVMQTAVLQKTAPPA